MNKCAMFYSVNVVGTFKWTTVSFIIKLNSSYSFLYYHTAVDSVVFIWLDATHEYEHETLKTHL